MSVEIKKFNESKIKVGNLDLDLSLSLREYFSFFVEGAQWSPKYKAGLWSGRINLFDSKTSTLPYGLFENLKSYLNKHNYNYVVDSAIQQFDFSYITDQYISDLVEELGCPNKPRDYQLDAVKTLLNQNKAIYLLPTGSGKSFCYYLICQILMKEIFDSRILIIVPNVSLVEQMEYDFIDYDINSGIIKDHIHKIYSGKSKTTDKRIVISTYQSLKELKDKSFFESFNTVIVDEVHKCTQSSSDVKVITEILQERCVCSKFRFGMSGSINDGKVNEIQLTSIIGSIFDSVKTKDLIEQNVLTDIKIKILLLKYDEDTIRKAYKMEYSDEMKYIMSQKNRLKFILKLFKKINSNSLIIFRNIDYGKLIFKYLKQVYPDRSIYYVDGTVPAEEREKIRLSIEGHEDAIIVASMPVFSTGINIPKLKYLIFAQSLKSKITLIQSIGRTLRKHKDKDQAVVIDLVDDFEYKRKKNYSLKHALERIKQYDAQHFNYKIKEINL